MATPSKPPLLYVLGAFGLMLGSFGSIYSLSSARQVLGTRDQFIAECHKEVEALPSMPGQLVSKDEIDRMVEREADAVYSRRGVQIPLAAMNLILSMLLFGGALRALRGDPWGLSAWSLAAIASLPYTVLDCAFSMVRANDLLAVFKETGGTMGALSAPSVSLMQIITVIRGGTELCYFAACVIYLRRAKVKALFLTPTA